MHSKLNQLVINRLPLALPPYTSSPRLYFSGLGSFAEIYRKFESLWWSILRSSSGHDHPGQNSFTSSRSSDPSRNASAVTSIPPEPRIQHILNHLYLPDLLRTECLDTDLSHSAASSGDDHTEQSWQGRPQLQAFLGYMEESVVQKPHVLIAYAWVLYMALFSGGRWIRAQMLNAGTDYWAERATGPHSSTRLNGAKSTGQGNGLSLFGFRSPEDGEDIKRDFKSRLMKVETALTVEERREIVQESQQIFRFCIFLVDELDSIHGTGDCIAQSHREDLSSVADAMSPRGQKDQTQFSWRHGLRIAPLFGLHAGRGSAAFVLLVGLFLVLTCYSRSFPPVP